MESPGAVIPTGQGQIGKVNGMAPAEESRGGGSAPAEGHNERATSAKKGYELIHKAGVYEVVGNLFTSCGAQSNILVSARYASPSSSSSITLSIIYRALACVIDEHPALSIIGVTQPSDKKKGNHRLWEARLRCINLEDCVEFVNAGVESEKQLAVLYERCHNTWFNTSDKTKPWWKVLVVNAAAGSWVVFVYHHNIGDGTSGYAFHRSLLATLNSPPSVNQREKFSTFVPSSTKPIQPCATDDVSSVNVSWRHLLASYLIPGYARYFVKRKYMIFSDIAHPSYTSPRLDNPFYSSSSAITQVRLLRLEHDFMKSVLAACRDNNTSFTALLHTLILVTLAVDLYPNATFGFSRLAVSVRHLLKSRPGKDVFTNAASMHYLPTRLKKFQSAGGSSSKSSENKENPFIPQYSVDGLRLWGLAREYKKGVSKFVGEKGHALQDFMAGKYLGEDDEEVTKRWALGLFQGNSFVLSNLGVFDPIKEVKEAPRDEEWSIKEIHFSTAAIKAGLCDFPVAINVASLKGGQCVIAASFEKGILSEAIVGKLLAGIRGRLDVLVG